MPQDRHDFEWMRLALAFGERGLGRTWPNPSVACLIVNNGRLLARGRTGNGGRPHAETIALGDAGDRFAGSTAFVTLEPCSHTGKTPPCAELLVEAGISRVVTPVADPDGRVCGAGHRQLEKSGITVQSGCMADAAIRSNLGFFLKTKCRRPMVTLKLAFSLDGRAAAESGASKWISGPESRRIVHVMRSRHDAVMVGRGTALRDDPDLTPRDAAVNHVPVRIVLDSDLSTPSDSCLGRSAATGPVWICHAATAPTNRRRAWQAIGATTIECDASPQSGLDLQNVMARLTEKGLTRILCEGGPELAASLVSEGLVDHFVGFSAGMLLGSRSRAMLGPLDLTSIADAPRLLLRGQQAVGNDIMSVWSKPVNSYGFTDGKNSTSGRM